MDRFRDVLLAVWQKACRHIDMGESTRTIAALLSGSLPLQQLLVRRFDLQHSCLDTVARGGVGEELSAASPRTHCDAAEMKRLLAWARTGRVLQHTRGGRRASKLALLVPDDVAGQVLVGAIGGGEQPVGVLVVAAGVERAFQDEHVQMVTLLLEPFGAILENDRRIQELATLREAAEADRRSLLSRLGRSDMNETIVGADSGLRDVMERVQLVSQSDVPVLILGETGTGKEVVARAIHNRSTRGTGPFIRVNCGAIPSELIDSQLFGHERGSFTGASATRQGWFERADRGTLFLDEIGELPLPAQVRLLRVLQDGYIERVGGHQLIHVDVRIVAATHRDLPGMVCDGKFREDLWYRIAVFPIRLPRLNERQEDIPALARRFARRAAQRFGLTYVDPTPDDIRLLTDYAWPGNIRELGAVIDRAAILGNGRSLEIATALGAGAALGPLGDLASGRGTGAAHLPAAAAASPIATLDTAMSQHIERALAATRGRIEGRYGAAQLLGINPHTLRARMRKLQIDWRRFRTPGAG